MKDMDMETLLFFNGHGGVLPLYAELEEMLGRIFPDVKKKVQKTQITFLNRRVFACVSFLRAWKKAELPDRYFVLTLGLPHALSSQRAAIQTEPRPGRWTIHIVISRPEELDEELFCWIRQAYDFSLRK